MRPHQKEPNRFSIVFFKHLTHGKKIAQAFGHFFVVDVDKAVVHPVPSHRFSESTFALGDFVFMVRELQVSAAAMNVKALTQQCAGHGRAFNMPTWPARAVGAAPPGIFGLGGFG